MKLEDIQELSDIYGKKARKLQDKLNEMEKNLAAIRKSYQSEINELSEETANAQKAVELAIADNMNLFQKRKTYNANGVKFGISKSRDSFEIPNEEITIQEIKDLLGERASIVIKTKESILKSTLGSLSNYELDLVGITKIPGADMPMVHLTEEKLI